MIITPHPNVIGAVAAHHRNELLAEAARTRQTRRAVGADGSRLCRWADLLAVVAAVSLPLLLAAGSAVAQEPSPPAQPSLVQAVD